MTRPPAFWPPLIPDDLRAALLANGAQSDEGDRVPLVKLFNPVGPGRWLLSEMLPDGDTLYGLCDLDQGAPELGYVSLSELAGVRLPLGLRIERDVHFTTRVPLTMWATLARRLGSTFAAEGMVRLMAARDAPPS
jgi:hypothetical protein